MALRVPTKLILLGSSQCRRAAWAMDLRTKLGPHALRRACATEMIRRNANPWYVKELLGHEDFRSLDVYTKLTILDLKAAHKKHHPREQADSVKDE